MLFTDAEQTISPAQAKPPVYGLLVAASERPIDPMDWSPGAIWNPELTNLADMTGLVQVDCVGNTDTGMTALDQDYGGSALPYAVFGSYRCTARGYRMADYAGRARRLLLATQSHWVAAQLWYNPLSLSVIPLTSTVSDEMTTAAQPVLDGIALIEQGIAYYGHGRQGMIHCTPQVLMHMVASNALRLVGGLWVTPMGNIVVADSGYTGSGPGNTTPTTSQWAYGTEVIDYALSPILDLPNADLVADPAAFMAEALDRTTNTVTVYSARLATTFWDRQIHVAAQLDLPVPAYGGA